jgi:diguanylate cyclase (GGDEF)-like protein
MDAQENALIRKINKRLKAFVEEGSAKAIDATGLDGSLAALVETVNELVLGGEGGDRCLSGSDFIEAGTSEFARANRYGRRLSVLAVEVDHCEAALAAHGEDFATVVRATATRVLAGALRSNDLFGQRAEGRFGVILPETEGEFAAEVGERIRAAFEAEDVFTGDQLIVFTVSIGAVGTIAADEGFEPTCRRATGAMEAASNAGGNRVVPG